MMTRHTRPTAATGVLLGVGALAAVLVAGCGGQTNTATSGSTSTSGSSAGQTTATSVPAAMPTDSAGAGTAPSARATTTGTPDCKANTLKLSLGQGDAAMSHDYVPLQFTNIGKSSCVIVGWPGVSYVTGDNGQQVGAPAVRDGLIGKSITLAPGQVASAMVTEVQVAVFDANVCKPTAVRGLRVYAPNDTASMFIAQPTTGCAGNPPDAQLHVQTILAGPGNQS